MGYKTKCHDCDEKDQVHQKRARMKKAAAKAEPNSSAAGNGEEANAEGSGHSPIWRWDDIPEIEMKWEEVLEILQQDKDKAFVLRSVVDLSILLAELKDCGQEADGGTEVADENEISLDADDMSMGVPIELVARRIAREVYEDTGYRYIYKETRPSKSDPEVKTFKFFCAQNEKEVTKPRLHPDPERQRERTAMKRFNCEGYLLVKMRTGVPREARIKLRHHPHPGYVDIGIPVHYKEMIREGVENDLPASKIWSSILQDDPETEISRKQVYREWTRLSQHQWRLDEDQIISAIALIEKYTEDHTTESIPIRELQGTSTVAFGFKEILDEVSEDTEEIAIDSTWKTNALGCELYAVIAERNGEAIPLAFMFTTHDETAPEGSKDLLLRDLLKFTKSRCPNIIFTLSDKDTSEINTCRHVFSDAKHQLCYWHAIRYLEKRLTENRPPASYDPRKAHAIFKFIDPTWAPGVTIGWLEDGVHEEDAEEDRPTEPLKVRINVASLKAHLVATSAIKEDESNAKIEKLQADLKVLEDELKAIKYGECEPKPAAPTTIEQAVEKTCRPALLILRQGSREIKVWPSPPAMKGLKALPQFCPPEHRPAIIEFFRRHLHLHETIPINESGRTRNSNEIWTEATREMYRYCRENNLAQAWSYLWNRWYSPKQWVLWARAACKAIPRIKTTMIVESTWRALKRHDLPQFNRPRLDLVVHVVLRYLLPRVQRKIVDLKGLRRQGRSIPLSPWKREWRALWKNYAKPDSQRGYERELAELAKKQVTDIDRAELEAELESDGQNERYYTSLEKWVCSCPSYLISRFLLCKHLVRKALGLKISTPVLFFHSLRRNHYPPFYNLPGINTTAESSVSDNEDEEEVDMIIIGTQSRTVCRTHSRTSSRASSEFDTASSAYDVDEIEEQLLEEGLSNEDSSSPEFDDMPEPFDDSTDTARVFVSPAQVDHMNGRWRTIMSLAQAPQGLHPKMYEGIKRAWDTIDKLGGDIEGELSARKMRRTYKDSTKATMYMD
ncbi:hypothetical protein PM082_023155 [Marasmius tenuissimus]|nr:hypothetical protein PM082_023155 [Marasmius tenuissimus]